MTDFNPFPDTENFEFDKGVDFTVDSWRDKEGKTHFKTTIYPPKNIFQRIVDRIKRKLRIGWTHIELDRRDYDRL